MKRGRNTRSAAGGANPGKIQAGGYGGSSSIAFRDTILGSPDRGNVLFLLPSDSRYYLNGWTRYRINQKAEWLWQNFGIVKEGTAGIARHTVGKGLSLVIDSTDHDWAMKAEADFDQYAASPDRCDIAARRNFYQAQTFAVEQRILRGEFFAADVQNPRWKDDRGETETPAFQTFDSQEITSPDTPADDVVDGVKVGKFSEPIEFYARTTNGDVVPIPAGKMRHWYKPHTSSQVRGISDFAQAVNGLVDIHELKRLTTRSAKAHQLVALVLKGINKKRTRGAMGAIKNAGSVDPDTQDKDTAQLEQLYGGAGAGIAYLDAEGDVKLVTSSSPSPLVEPFITDLLMRDVCAAWGVPMEFFWAVAKLNSANVRFILSKADLFFQILADELAGVFCTPLAYRYITWRIQTGVLPKPKDPNWTIGWQGPRRITIDNGRDGNMKLQFLANGATNLKRLYNEEGENWLPHTRQWFREFKIAKQIAIEEGVPEAFNAWRALQPGAKGTASDTTAEEMDEQDAETETDENKPAEPARKNDTGEKEDKPAPKKKPAARKKK